MKKTFNKKIVSTIAISFSIAAATLVYANMDKTENEIKEVQLNQNKEVANKDISNNNLKEIKSTNKEIPTDLKELKEGLHYDVLKTPLTIAPSKGVVITEFFWLGCPHCQNFEPEVVKWMQRFEDETDVTLSKIAVPGSERWNLDSKTYFAMKRVGATQEQTTEMLRLYQNEARVYKMLPTKDRIEDFLKEIGLDSEKVMDIIENDNSINEDLNFANEQFKNAEATGVPTFVVNGKYKIKFDDVKSNEDIYQILRSLSYKK